MSPLTVMVVAVLASIVQVAVASQGWPMSRCRQIPGHETWRGHFEPSPPPPTKAHAEVKSNAPTHPLPRRVLNGPIPINLLSASNHIEGSHRWVYPRQFQSSLRIPACGKTLCGSLDARVASPRFRRRRADGRQRRRDGLPSPSGRCFGSGGSLRWTMHLYTSALGRRSRSPP